MNKNIKLKAAALVAAASMIPASGCFLQKDKDDTIPVNADEPSAVETADTPVISSLPESSAPEKKDASSAAGKEKESKKEKEKSSSSASKKTESKKTESKKPSDTSSKEPEDEKPQSVLVSETQLSMSVGDERYISANVLPKSEQVIWSCSDESIAVVDESGRIAALKAGSCTVTAAAKSDKSVSSAISVTITNGSSGTSGETASSTPSQTTTYVYTQPGSTQTVTSSETESGSSEAPEAEEITLTLDTEVLTVGDTIGAHITQSPENSAPVHAYLTSSDESVASINYDGTITANSQGACTITAVSEDGELESSVIIAVTEPVESEEPSHGDGTDYPREECYIDGILIVNKTYSIPRSYNPGGLTPECSAAFSQLCQGAANDGISIWLASGFRSYDYQSNLYWSYVSYYGQSSADTFSARPGHSEHQTGLAIDVNDVSDWFAGTPAAIWLENHAHEYGFIIRYPRGKQDITGYKYEPWHIRYIGDKATDIYESGLTLEEYFGITSQYDY